MRNNAAFTLVELLVVISMISLLSSVVFASVNSARGKARDSTRVAALKQVQLALELYFDKYGSYPATSGSWYSDCNPPIPSHGSWITNLAPLTEFIPTLPREPRSPNNPDPWCFFYGKDVVLDCGGASPRPYILIFSVENSSFALPTHNNFLGAKARYCLMP